MSWVWLMSGRECVQVIPLRTLPEAYSLTETLVRCKADLSFHPIRTLAGSGLAS